MLGLPVAIGSAAVLTQGNGLDIKLRCQAGELWAQCLKEASEGGVAEGNGMLLRGDPKPCQETRLSLPRFFHIFVFRLCVAPRRVMAHPRLWVGDERRQPSPGRNERADERPPDPFGRGLRGWLRDGGGGVSQYSDGCDEEGDPTAPRGTIHKYGIHEYIETYILFASFLCGYDDKHTTCTTPCVQTALTSLPQEPHQPPIPLSTILGPVWRIAKALQATKHPHPRSRHAGRLSRPPDPVSLALTSPGDCRGSTPVGSWPRPRGRSHPMHSTRRPDSSSSPNPVTSLTRG